MLWFPIFPKHELWHRPVYYSDIYLDRLFIIYLKSGIDRFSVTPTISCPVFRYVLSPSFCYFHLHFRTCPICIIGIISYSHMDPCLNNYVDVICTCTTLNIKLVTTTCCNK